MIGDKVKQLRTEKRMSISELAHKAGVAKSYLSLLERNIQQNPSINFLTKIGSVLNVPVDYFIQQPANQPELDQGWTALIIEAMNSDVTKEQFKEFIEFRKGRSGQRDRNIVPPHPFT